MHEFDMSVCNLWSENFI